MDNWEFFAPDKSVVYEITNFDDGNGRIARAISDLMLAKSDQNSDRFYSMSSQILLEK